MYFQILRVPNLAAMIRAPHPTFLKVTSFQDYELVNQLGLGGFDLDGQILSSFDDTFDLSHLLQSRNEKLLWSTRACQWLAILRSYINSTQWLPVRMPCQTINAVPSIHMPAVRVCYADSAFTPVLLLVVVLLCDRHVRLRKRHALGSTCLVVHSWVHVATAGCGVCTNDLHPLSLSALESFLPNTAVRMLVTCRNMRGLLAFVGTLKVAGRGCKCSIILCFGVVARIVAACSCT